jgi:pimeloyl-ACP methyl ester carboxylesterase
VTHPPPLDERMDDLHAVPDAAEVDRAALPGVSEGGPLSIMFAASFPERVRSLVLYGATPRAAQELPDFPWGFTPAEVSAMLANIDAHWGVLRRNSLWGRPPMCPAFANCGGDMSGQARVRRWRGCCSRRTWRSTYALCSPAYVPRLSC